MAWDVRAVPQGMEQQRSGREPLMPAGPGGAEQHGDTAGIGNLRYVGLRRD